MRIGTPQTLLSWVRKAQVDAGQRPGVTTAEAAEVKQLRLADVLKTGTEASGGVGVGTALCREIRCSTA